MSWKTPLAREFVVKPGRARPGSVRLRTLEDAGNYLIATTGNVTRDDALAYLGTLLMDAAATDDPEDVAAATDQLARYLHSKYLL